MTHVTYVFADSMDYTGISTELIFPPGQALNRQCIDIEIIDDTVLENEELFGFIFSSVQDDPAVFIPTVGSFATISILDPEDGMYVCRNAVLYTISLTLVEIIWFGRHFS